MKRCSVLLIKEVQIKSSDIMLMSLRIAVTNKKKKASIDKDVDILEHCILSIGMESGTAAMENTRKALKIENKAAVVQQSHCVEHS